MKIIIKNRLIFFEPSNQEELAEFTDEDYELCINHINTHWHFDKIKEYNLTSEWFVIKYKHPEGDKVTYQWQVKRSQNSEF